MSILKIRPFFNFLLFFSEYEVSFFYSTTIGSWIISLILTTLIQLHRPFCFYVKRLKYKAYRCSPVLNKLTKHSRFKYKSVYCTNLVLIYIFISMYFYRYAVNYYWRYYVKNFKFQFLNKPLSSINRWKYNRL